MKLIVLMCLEEDSEASLGIFETHGVQVFSELELTGHMSSLLKQHSPWPTEQDDSVYSRMFFAIVADEKADRVFRAVEEKQKNNPKKHPIRAFQMNVEKMI